MKSHISIKTTFAKRIFPIIICSILVALNFSSCSVAEANEGIYLLCTEWDQAGMYAKYCPDNVRAGCWSTAIAQILYFHGMMPAGEIDYVTSAGYKVSEDLDSYKFNWDLFAEKLDDSISIESIDQVAKYIYYTSVVLEKDFNTGQYNTIKNEYKDGVTIMKVDNAVKNLENHFDCKVKDYHYAKKDLAAYQDDIESLIKKEIDSNRPIMMYIQSENNGHATVIDGYSYLDEKFLVHVNVGAGGVGNKWYDFYKPIVSQLDDMNHRVLLTIEPSLNNSKNAAQTLDKTKFLLKTKWDIEGDYSKFYPGNKPTSYKPVGYWSTALSQILAYHRYEPAGEIIYETGSGIKIEEKLDSYEFNWDLFMERLDAKTSEKSIEQVAKYNYFTEAVLERDYGSDGYKTIVEDESNIDVTKAVNNINKYFKSNAKAYRYLGEEIKPSKDEIVKLIRKEIDKKCPLLLYYKPYSGEGTCVVIDGYEEKNNKFLAHINAGRDGWNNQWYELFGLLTDMKYLIIITIE